MNRTIDQYAKCDPFQVVSGSHAQALHFAKDAKADIAELAARIAALEAENERLRKALEQISKADFLDFSLSPERSAVPMALAALEAKP